MKNKQIQIVLLITTLLALLNSVTRAVSQCMDNCLECDLSVTCKQCSKNRQCCGSGCLDCPDGIRCDKCDIGICEHVSSCEDNCQVCQKQSSVCQNCFSGYYLNTKKNICLPIMGFPNCSNLSYDGLECIECQPGNFIFIDENNQGICKVNKDRHPNCKQLEYDWFHDEYYCIHCLDNFREVAQGNGKQCVSCGDGCQVCEKYGCAVCFPGFYQESGVSCQKCEEGCAQCSNSICYQCKEGYKIESHKCTKKSTKNQIFHEAESTQSQGLGGVQIVLIIIVSLGVIVGLSFLVFCLFLKDCFKSDEYRPYLLQRTPFLHMGDRSETEGQ